MTRWWFPCQRPGWWVGGGATRCSHLLKAFSAPWQFGSVALSLEVGSRYPCIWVTEFGCHWHYSSGHELKLWISLYDLGTKALARNQETTEFALTTSYLQWLGICLSTTNGLLSRCGDTSYWRKGSLQPPQTTRFGNLRDGHDPSQLPLLNQTIGILPLHFEPTQGCQKCQGCSGTVYCLVGSPM